MINLQKVLALMGIHNLTSVFLRIINHIPEHLGLGVDFFFLPLTLLLLITSLKSKHCLKKTRMINMPAAEEQFWKALLETRLLLSPVPKKPRKKPVLA